jgi:ankyrin repeat protein
LFKLKKEGKNGGDLGLDECDSEGRTALMRAAAVGALDITELLLAAGCQKYVKDSQGLTAANHASKVGVSVYMRFSAQLMLQ